MPEKHLSKQDEKKMPQGEHSDENSQGNTGENAGGNPNLRCLFLAWLIPGLGHLYMGDIKRGLILCITISGLFISGLLIGGVGVVDYKLNKAWFFGQMFNGPAVVLAIVRSKTLMTYPDAPVATSRYFGTPHEPNAYAPSFGRPNEIGILYTALAGLLNLFIFYDVWDRSQGRKARKNNAAQLESSQVNT